MQLFCWINCTPLYTHPGVFNHQTEVLNWTLDRPLRKASLVLKRRYSLKWILSKLFCMRYFSLHAKDLRLFKVQWPRIVLDGWIRGLKMASRNGICFLASYQLQSKILYTSEQLDSKNLLSNLEHEIVHTMVKNKIQIFSWFDALYMKSSILEYTYTCTSWRCSIKNKYLNHLVQARKNNNLLIVSFNFATKYPTWQQLILIRKSL